MTGRKIHAKFDSSVEHEGKTHSWKKDDEIFYDPDHKVACNDYDTYLKMGGSPIDTTRQTTFSGGYKKMTLEEKLEIMKAIHEKALPLAIETVKRIREMEGFSDMATEDAVVAIESFTRTFATPLTR